MTYLSRITPAGAGKTMSSSSTASKRWDHPRRCGENRADAASTATLEGSPPQVRGKQIKAGGVGGTDRITPAGAGKTRRCCAHRPKFQDHPRRCGENYTMTVPCLSVGGSPPQVRGKHIIHGTCPSTEGITPAGAGKTLVFVSVKKPFLGSPPQVRGKPQCY